MSQYPPDSSAAAQWAVPDPPPGSGAAHLPLNPITIGQYFSFPMTRAVFAPATGNHRDDGLPMTNLHMPRLGNDTAGVESLRRTCASYSEHLQRTVVVDEPSTRIVAIAGDDLDAITMPAALGRHVWTVLAAEMAAGPTIAGPGPSRWTFLTERTHKTRLTCSRSLHNSGVTLVPSGSQIILPSWQDTTATYVWIEAPRPALPMPAWSRVMSTASRIVAAQSRDECAS